MKQYIIIILIAFHLVSSSAYAAKTFLDKDYLYNEHHHFHNGSSHQHNHSHAQININYVDFFTDTYNINLYNIKNKKQTYIETVSWIPNPTLESLFRPPKI